MTAPTVRAARFALAEALISSPAAREEAEEQLQRALAEPGDQPEDWEVHLALGRLDVARGDPSAALQHLVRAVLSAPAEVADAPAAEALQLVQDYGRSAARRLGSHVIRSITNLGASHDTRVVPALAAKLALLRNDVSSARAIVEQHNDGRGDELAAADLVSRATELLRREEPAEARQLIEQAGPPPGETPLDSLHALALLAGGDAEGALHAVRGTDRDPLAAAISTIAKLARAAEPGSDRLALLDEALSDAATAARLDPRSPELLVLRAQVLLEGGIDVNHGRDLLSRGLRRLTRPIDDVLWFHVESTVRTDPSFHAFLIELRSQQEQHERVRELAVRLPLTGLPPAQQAELWSVTSHSHLAVHDAGSARAALLRASEAFEEAGDFTAASRAAEGAHELEHDVRSTLRLVRLHWSASFDEPSAEDLEPCARLLRGLELLDGAEDDVPDSELGQANQLRGLIRWRLHDLTDGPVEDLWAAVAHLVAAAELMPDDAYASAYASSALQEVDLYGSALRYAERAHELAPTDDWVAERLILGQCNWAGELDERGWTLLARTPDERWRRQITAVRDLLANDIEALRANLEVLEGDDDWLQASRAYAQVYCLGLEGARASLERLVETKTASQDRVEALEALLILDPERAAQTLAATEATLPPLARARLEATHSVLRTDGAVGSEEVTALIQELRRPFQGRELACYLRAHAVARPGLSGAVRVLRRLADAAAERATLLEEADPLRQDLLGVPAEQRAKPQVETALAALSTAVGAGSSHASAGTAGFRGEPGTPDQDSFPGSLVRALHRMATTRLADTSADPAP